MPEIGPAQIAVVVFVAAYTLVIGDMVHRTIVALFAGFLIVALGVIDQHTALSHVDFNVIFLLIGMMVIASVIGRSGFFLWLAALTVRATRGDPYRLLVALSIVTAVLSAVLDNVTAVVLLAPIAFSVAERRGIPPLPLLISIVLASNIGGTATLIGDPPNIIIGSAFDKDFVAFLLHTGPAALVSLVLYLGLARWLFRRELRAPALSVAEARALGAFDRSTLDRRLAGRSLAVLGVTLLGFLLARPLGLEAATVALLGASVVLLITRVDVHKVLGDVEWPTLLFFVGLFVLVGGLVETGVIARMAEATLGLTGGDPRATAFVVLWLSALLSAVVDNIPYTATMVPLIQELARHGVNIEPSIWALALGADFGGNATLVGASANVVVASMSEARGQPISFGQFFKYGLPVALMTMLVASLELFIRYVVL